MKLLLVPAVLCGLLLACGMLQAETLGGVSVYGKYKTTMTREIDQNGERVLSGSVVCNTRRYGCNTLLQGDCERRVMQLVDSGFIGLNAFGTIPSPYVITDPNKPAVRPLRISL